MLVWLQSCHNLSCLEPERLQQCSQVGVQHQQRLRLRLSAPSRFLLFHCGVRHQSHSDLSFTRLAILSDWWLGKVLSARQWNVCRPRRHKSALVRSVSVWSDSLPLFALDFLCFYFFTFSHLFYLQWQAGTTKYYSCWGAVRYDFKDTLLWLPDRVINLLTICSLMSMCCDLFLVYIQTSEIL